MFAPDGAHLLTFRDTLPPSAVPSTLIIDRHGRMAARILGAITETSLRQLVTDILTEGGASASHQRRQQAPRTEGHAQ